jgi:FkbM family methyltransferase
VGDKGHVYAFEPIPLNVACIRRNIRINQFENVDVIANAVSDHDGQLSIQVTYHPGGATLEGAGIAGDAYSTMTVNTITLDALLKHSSMPAPDFLKIDVEGAEYHVLQGMQELLAQHHPLILYEIDAADQAEFQQKQARCRALLEAANYHISELPNAYPDIEHNVAHFVAFLSNSS